MNNQFKIEENIGHILEGTPAETHYIHFHVYADINYSILLNYFLRSWFEKQTLTVTEISTMTNSSPLCSRYGTLLRKFSSYIRIFWGGRVQNHIWITVPSLMTKYLCISSYITIKKPFVLYDFATDPLWIPYTRKIFFSFLTVYKVKEM